MRGGGKIFRARYIADFGDCSKYLSKMSKSLHINHFSMVDSSRIEALFVRGNSHRAKLCIPYIGRETFKSLCVIGQNPSDASKEVADRTIRYIEELIYKNYPEFSQIVMLNLFSRVDKKKSQVNDLLDDECERVFQSTVREHEDVLLIYGQLKINGAYNFPKRALEIKALLTGKKIWKLDIGKTYAPHPRNSIINYQKFDIALCTHDLLDVHDN